MDLHVKLIHPAAVMPYFAHPGDAGADLCTTQRIVLAPNGGRGFAPTGLVLEIPDGYVGLIHPRSGLAAKHGVTVLNAPGTIDSGYRGELAVVLVNHGSTRVALKPGERVAQLLIQKVERPFYLLSKDLSETTRGAGGFGSTGS